jgi:hypothetical protein
LAGLGVGLLLLGAFFERLHPIETEMTVVGAIMLAVAHLTNWRLRIRKRLET